MKILIIEDDIIFGEMLSMYLSEEDFTVQRAPSGEEGLQALQTFAPDTILLDLILPDTDGVQLCAVLREFTDVPIIIISMINKVRERIQALTVGADDYLCKPFSMQELKARILAANRRANMIPPSYIQLGVTQDNIEAEDRNRIRLNLERRSMYIRNRLVETTYSEFEIMRLFYKNPGKVFSRDVLINSIRGIDSYVNERSIDVHVTNLRKKVEVNPRKPHYIKTVWGIGYKFVFPSGS
jgi:DNA-binding response OmpR family regulator